MPSKDKLNELTVFLEFLKSLWAILAQISVLFPYSSRFIDAIPVEPIEPGYPFYFLPPALIPLVATLFSVFIILVTFNQRVQYEDQQRRLLIHKGMLGFLGGILALLAYFGLRQVDVGAEMCNVGLCDFWHLRQVMKLVLDAMLLGCYTLFFGMITRAFMILGMITFYGRSKPSLSD